MGSKQRWQTRDISEELAARYRAEGWWTDQTLGQLVADGLAASADAELAVHSMMRPYRGSIGEVAAAAGEFAGWLGAQGIGPGDVVVFQLPNWMEAAVAIWGSALAGVTVVPVVHFYGAKEIGHIVRVTEPTLIITPDRFGPLDYVERYTELIGASGTRWLVVGDTPGDQLPAGAQPFSVALGGQALAAPVPVDPDQPALIAFTSGTTRDAKGVIHSHRTIACEVRDLGSHMPGSGRPPINGAPVGHFIGMLGGLLCPLVRGGESIHFIDVWNPGEVLRLMVEEDLVMLGGATYFLTSLLDHPDFTDEHIGHIPQLGLGGSSVPAAVTERAAGLGIKVFRAYGSTEHPSITGCSLDDPEDKRLHTDGRPFAGIEIRLDEGGQILSRGPDLCLGYTDPTLTANAFDDDGWYHTGDVGVLDDDGYLTIVDRVSDVIIRGGENISPMEVEELLLGLDAVAEVAVVAAPDERLGERAAAVVRLREGREAPTLDDVRAALDAAGLAKQKWPESIHVVDEFPRTPSGKVQKFVLRQQLRNGQFP